MKRLYDSERTSAAASGQEEVTCPFCGSADVELLALFGSQLLTDQYYCRVCRTPFEHLRADADAADEWADSANSGHPED